MTEDKRLSTSAPGTSRLRRAGTLGNVAARSVGRQAYTRLSTLGRDPDERARRAQADALATAEELVTALGSMKGAAMKVGQTLSLLDLDLIPPESRPAFQQKLAVLRDSAPKIDDAVMLSHIRAELGERIHDIADIHPTAIAAASLGQVYRAQLRNGVDVAIKIQYPRIAEIIDADMRNLAVMLRLSQRFLPRTDIAAIIDQVTGHLRSEVNYRREADMQRYMASRYRSHPYIRIPAVIDELCTDRVLVTEYVSGIGFDEMVTLDADTRNQIGETIYRFYCGGAYNDGGFCADPHPGNVLLDDDGRVAFLDYGLYTSLRPQSLALEREVLRCCREGNADRLRSALRDANVLVDENLTADEVLDYLRGAAWWHIDDQMVTITPEVANAALVAAVYPTSQYFSAARRQSIPGDHVFARRTEFHACAMLGQLEATHNWYRIEAEWLDGEPSVTELGLIHQDWLSHVGK